MVTQELLGYIRGEVAKGKTREEIKGVLLGGGGWSEDDLSEAFREIIPLSQPSFSPPTSFSLPPSPLRSAGTPSSYSPSPSLLKPSLSSNPPSSRSRSFLKFFIILIIIGGLGFGFWFYRPQITSLWNSLINSSSQLFTPFLSTNQNVGSNNTVIAPIPTMPAVAVKDCGTGIAPKLGVSSTYENNSVFSCLGASAANCDNARGILKDDFFPTAFEITKSTQSTEPQGSCSFKLSYPANSTLTDITGKQLAGQYISCPIDTVKAIDNTKPASPKFNVPSKTDLSKYGSDIYFYGTLGLFVENNLDQNKIQALGCNGPYIQSVIASYAAKKTK